MARFEVPEGWSVQAFCFALDPSPEQAACLRRQFGGRRYARNWAVRTLKDDLDRYHATGEETGKPSLAGLRKRWNRVKDAEVPTPRPGKCGGRRSARRRSRTASRARWTATGTGRPPAPGNGRAGGPGSPGSPRRAATGTGSRSPPEPSGSSRRPPRHPPQDRHRARAREHPPAGTPPGQRPCPDPRSHRVTEGNPADSGIPGTRPAPHPAPGRPGPRHGSGSTSGSGFLPPSPARTGKCSSGYRTPARWRQR